MSTPSVLVSMALVKNSTWPTPIGSRIWRIGQPAFAPYLRLPFRNAPLNFIPTLRLVILIGTILFAVAAVALLPFWNWLGDHDHRVWFWTALSGAVMGVVSLPLIRKHTGEGRLG